MEIIRDKLDPWVGRWVGGVKGSGWGQEEGCLPSALAAAAASSGTHLECWMSKRETPSLSEDGLEQQGGTRRRRTFCDLLPECTWPRCAEVRLLSSRFFCPLQCPDAAPLTHTHSLSVRGRMTMDR